MNCTLSLGPLDHLQKIVFGARSGIVRDFKGVRTGRKARARNALQNPAFPAEHFE